ncbi:MAG: hypothetical protein WDA22_17245 [Bacteroidota bacterium]
MKKIIFVGILFAMIIFGCDEKSTIIQQVNIASPTTSITTVNLPGYYLNVVNGVDYTKDTIHIVSFSTDSIIINVSSVSYANGRVIISLYDSKSVILREDTISGTKSIIIDRSLSGSIKSIRFRSNNFTGILSVSITSVHQQQRKDLIFGIWDWIASYGGGSVITPKSVGYTVKHIYYRDSTFEIYKRDTVFQKGVFSIRRDKRWPSYPDSGLVMFRIFSNTNTWNSAVEFNGQDTLMFAGVGALDADGELFSRK